MTRVYLLAMLSALAAGPAGASECGEARTLAQHFKAALAVEEGLKHAAQAYEAKQRLGEALKQVQSACAPRRANVLVLPLGYVVAPPGNLSRASFAPPAEWRLTLSTQAGPASGVVYPPATVSLPEGERWETAPQAQTPPGELVIAFATDVPLTVEEPEPGRGTWSLAVKAVQTVKRSQLAACKGLPVKLAPSGCALLAQLAPIVKAGALPARGRAFPLGEWQYGWHSELELGDEELAQTGESPPARLDLALEVSAPIAGFSSGKTLPITFEDNALARAAGATLKLGHGGCGEDDEACEKQRFGVEVWFDRVFGVPFLRETPAITEGALVGKVADRLARPLAGQRMLFVQGARRVITSTDERGDYRFDWLAGGDAVVVPVGKDPANVLKGDEKRAIKVGVHELKAPVIFMNKLWQ